MTPRIGLVREAALEYLEYDSTFMRMLSSVGGAAAARLLWAVGDTTRAFTVASRVHRSGGSRGASTAIERALRRRPAALRAFYESHIQRSIHGREAQPFLHHAAALLGYRAIIVKSARDRERGVLILDYSYIFPLFAALFDIEAVASRYQIVLEPSWRGICTADVLCYSAFDFPVLVQSIEPRDTAFINGLRTNLATVPTAANWWIDHRLIKPIPGVQRDIDIIVVASWSSLKRHWRLFRMLHQLRKRGHRLRMALVGYRGDKTLTDIRQEAEYFGVADQVELHENVPLEEVGRLLARSKVHVLWSRKEGANRAIIEAMLADVPVVVRRGLSYGFAYPYINPQTGSFAEEHELGDVVLDMIENRGRYRPREWIMQHMSCQRATTVLEDAVREIAVQRSEPWTTGLTVKTSRLETQGYWNPEDRMRFEADYAFVTAQIRPLPHATG